MFTLGFCLVKANMVEKIDLKLHDQKGIVFLNRNMLLIIGEDESTLLVLNKDKINNLNKFKYSNLNILMLEDNLINLEANQKLVLEDEIEIDDVTYSKQGGLIYVNYEDSNMCIYTGGAYNTSSCQFIYFYNSDVKNIYPYEKNELIIYDYKKPLPTPVLERMYEDSVDTHILRDDTIAIMKIGEEDYEFIVIDNE